MKVVIDGKEYEVNDKPVDPKTTGVIIEDQTFLQEKLKEVEKLAKGEN